MKTIIKDSLILFAITLVAGLLLAVVNQITAPKIDEAKKKQKEEACKAVFVDASSFKEVPELLEDADVVAYQATDSKIQCTEILAAYDENNNLLGYILNMTTKEGYGGEISFMMGVRNDRTVNALSILTTNETVGLGLQAESVLLPQFENKNVGTFKYTKMGSTAPDEIDAISSATITTNAFVNAVNNGLGLFDIISGKGGAF